jgi:hypothetical protein
VQRAAEGEALRLAARVANGLLNNPETEGGGLEGPAYATKDLWLEMVSVTTNAGGATAALLVHPPEPGSFDVFYTPSLPASNGWSWVARGLPGQTNFSLAHVPADRGSFILGTTNGMDA